jgi:hypothetical protein
MRRSSFYTRAGRTLSLKKFIPTLQVFTALTSGIQVLWSVTLIEPQFIPDVSKDGSFFAFIEEFSYLVGLWVLFG